MPRPWDGKDVACGRWPTPPHCCVPHPQNCGHIRATLAQTRKMSPEMKADDPPAFAGIKPAVK